MIIEYNRYAIDAGKADALEQAYARAGAVLDADAHCLR